MSLDSACKNAGADGALGSRRAESAAASFVAAHAGFDRILTFDMGGTSTDVAVCVAGRPEITRETNGRRLPGAGACGRCREHRRRRRLDRVRRRGNRRASRRAPERRRRARGPRVTAAAVRPRPSPTRTSCSGHLPPRLLGGAMELDVDAARVAVARVAEARGLGVARARRRRSSTWSTRHARSAPGRHRAARPCPERLRAGLLRRRRRAARQRAGRAAGLLTR